MAVIAQVEKYAPLARRIGYSVGLENLVARVSAIAAVYHSQHSLSYTDFRSLVVEQFGLKKSPDESVAHLGNFYRSLNLLKLFGRQLEPLYELDALAILRELLARDESRSDRAARFVLTQAVLEADGDVTVNGLLCAFDHAQFRVLLEAMCAEKSRRLRNVVRSPALFAKVNEIVTIRNQAAASGRGGGQTPGASRFGRRTTPLSGMRRSAPLSPSVDEGSTISDDYIEKAAQTRRRWAEDLGLFADGVVTDLGQRILNQLGDSLLARTPEQGAAVFWPYASDLAKLRIQPSQLGAPTFEAWDLLTALGRAYVPASQKEGPAMDADEVVEFLRQVSDLYRGARADKSLIRNALPLYVAEPVLAGWCAAHERPLPSLGEILDLEFRKPKRRVQKMIIRGTVGSLYFMR